MDTESRIGYSLAPILDTLQEGLAIFGPDRRVLYINDRMRALTGGTYLTDGVVNRMTRRHRFLTSKGVELAESDYPIERAFRGEETDNEILEYVSEDAQHRWFLVNCRLVHYDDGTLRYIVATVHDVSNRKHREDKLSFMVESAKTVSLNADLDTRMIEKARLAVPTLADWAAIDMLNDTRTNTRRVALIHRDPAQVEILQEYERTYPPNPKDAGSPYQVITKLEPIFVPVLTDAIYERIRNPEARAALKKLNVKSIMVLPIMSRGMGLGALTLAYAESGRMYSEDDFDFFREYCVHVGIAMDNAYLFDEIMRRDTSKDLFLAQLSHELRNPLAPIKSSLELLKVLELLPEVREEVEVIEHQFDHMAKLLGDLLDVSRFTQGKITITTRPTELRELVERALKSTDTLLRTADITLHFSYPPTQLFAEVDETRLEQVIVNLMSNAAKFTPAGGTIWVEIERENERAIIRIRDNGAGISAEDLPKIFNMYYQGRRETIANAGLGIGLLLVDQIVKLHGGTITAQSEGVGKGSQFTISLPLIQSQESKRAAKQPAANALRKKILVIDDNAQAADSLVKLLNKLGAKATALYSAAETLELSDLDSYNVLLLDVGMPEIDGYELVRMLRERGFRKPIVALTGYGMADDKKKAMESGFTAHLTKPVGISEITETLATFYG